MDSSYVCRVKITAHEDVIGLKDQSLSLHWVFLNGKVGPARR